MKNKLSYSKLYYVLNDLYTLLQENNYPTLYLDALKDTQRALLILELLNIAYLAKIS